MTIPEELDKTHMLVHIASKTFDFDFRNNIFYCPEWYYFKPCAYIGLYKDKSVRAVGKIAVIVKAIRERGSIKFTPEFGTLTDEMKRRIGHAMDYDDSITGTASGNICRYFIAEQFYKTDFMKTTPGGQREAISFNLTQVLGTDVPDSAEALARALRGKTWGGAQAKSSYGPYGTGASQPYGDPFFFRKSGAQSGDAAPYTASGTSESHAAPIGPSPDDDLKDTARLAAKYKKPEYLKDAAGSELSRIPSAGGKLKRLKEIHKIFKDEAGWADYYKEILLDLFTQYQKEPFESGSAESIIYIAGGLGEPDLLTVYFDSMLDSEPSADGKIKTLLAMYDAFKGAASWSGYFSGKAKALFDDAAGEVRLDNAAAKDRALRPLKERLAMSDADYIGAIYRALEDADTSAVYDTLKACGFPDALIANAMSARFIDAVCKNTELDARLPYAAEFNALRESMWSLNGMLRLTSPTDKPETENVKPDDFLKAYGRFTDCLTYVKQNIKADRSQIETYSGIYQRCLPAVQAKVDAAQQTSAVKNISGPGDITEDYIAELINQKPLDEETVTRRLFYKAEYILKQRFGEGISASDMINMAYEQGCIRESEMKTLHELRRRRNTIEHPNGGFSLKPTKGKLRDWASAVFLLEKVLPAR